MSYYSDPTAAKALGGINREFSRLEKKAKRLRERFERGQITEADLERAQAQFTGIYRHVLRNVLAEPRE
jgi:outer membrane protein TolC